MVMRSQTTDGRSASKCQGKWPDQLLTHRFGLSTLRQRSAPPACLARTPEKRKNSHWFGGSYGESRVKGSVCIGLRASCRVCACPAEWRHFEIRRIATRYDRLARNYLASVCLAGMPHFLLNKHKQASL